MKRDQRIKAAADLIRQAQLQKLRKPGDVSEDFCGQLLREGYSYNQALKIITVDANATDVQVSRLAAYIDDMRN